ncbi:hypothetical protein U9M48_027629 [Paspalum notatum var. saurae]|uniref:Uncharacterized protein n=1 Tax=Paspalum notatum var. saurae TaxID=547442 RepID=A0AAQ3WZS4_PASNO
MVIMGCLLQFKWEDVTWDGTGHRRTHNGLLGNLIRVHNPGVVEKNGETIPVTTWKHFALAPHVMYGSVQGLVTNSWLKSQGQPVGRFRDASETYLTAEEYGSISLPLFEDQPGPYKALCDLWASEEFQERSRKHRNAGTKNATHKLGGCDDRRVAECRRHAEYGKEMERRHGEGFDWRTAPVDPQAVYESGGGKSHGRYSMFNGMIDSRQVQRRFASQSSDGSSSRQRRTTSEMEIDSLRQEIQKRDAFLKAQEEYQKEQQAHAECLHAQQMATIQAMYQAQGMTFVMPEVASAPVPPQWGMFAQMSFSPAPQGSGVQGSNPYQTPPPASGQHADQHIDPALGDFVNNLFVSGGSGHNSNEPAGLVPAIKNYVSTKG